MYPIVRRLEKMKEGIEKVTAQKNALLFAKNFKDAVLAWRR